MPEDQEEEETPKKVTKSKSPVSKPNTAMWKKRCLSLSLKQSLKQELEVEEQEEESTQ
ncbi:MAG: hypothetical protein R3C24_03025 [Cyanobacteriota/Melainabacteria group bacterium]